MSLRCLAGSATLGVLCALSAPAPAALAAGTSAVRPTVQSVAPLNANVGDRLTIKGRNLATRGTRRTTVVFKTGAKIVTVRVTRATRTKITLVVPTTLARYLAVRNGVAQPTRFRLKVRAQRAGARYTAVAKSPRIGLLTGLPGGPAGVNDLLPPPGLDPSDDCNGDGRLDSADDLVIETADGSFSPCAADNNVP